MIKDDRWMGKGEVDCQQVWRMTAARAGVNMTAIRKGTYMMTAAWVRVRMTASRDLG